MNLEDELAVRALLPAYARAVDAGDADAVAALFAEDGVLRAEGAPDFGGRERIRKLYAKLLGEIQASSHLVGEPLVEPLGEGAARATAAVHAWDRYHDPDRADELSLGTYTAEARSQPGEGWLLQSLALRFPITRKIGE